MSEKQHQCQIFEANVRFWQANVGKWAAQRQVDHGKHQIFRAESILTGNSGTQISYINDISRQFSKMSGRHALACYVMRCRSPAVDSKGQRNRSLLTQEHAVPMPGLDASF